MNSGVHRKNSLGPKFCNWSFPLPKHADRSIAGNRYFAKVAPQIARMRGVTERRHDQFGVVLTVATPTRA